MTGSTHIMASQKHNEIGYLPLIIPSSIMNFPHNIVGFHAKEFPHEGRSHQNINRVADIASPIRTLKNTWENKIIQRNIWGMELMKQTIFVVNFLLGGPELSFSRLRTENGMEPSRFINPSHRNYIKKSDKHTSRSLCDCICFLNRSWKSFTSFKSCSCSACSRPFAAASSCSAYKNWSRNFFLSASVRIKNWIRGYKIPAILSSSFSFLKCTPLHRFSKLDIFKIKISLEKHKSIPFTYIYLYIYIMFDDVCQVYQHTFYHCLPLTHTWWTD